MTEVETAAEIPQSIAHFLRDHNLPASDTDGRTTCAFAAMPWNDTALEIAHGPSTGDDLNAVSHAFGAWPKPVRW